MKFIFVLIILFSTNCSNKILHSENLSPQTIEEIEKILEKPILDHNDFFERANQRYHLADYYGAIEDYGYSIYIKPDFGKAYINRSFAFSKIGNYSSAIQENYFTNQ